MKHPTVFHLRIFRIVEIVFVSLFIISVFFPYIWGIRPKEYFWDIWSNNIPFWPSFFVVGLPLILSLFLFILKFGKFKFGKLTISLIQWSALIIYSFIMVLVLIEETMSRIDSVSLFNYTPVILSLVFSLFLIVSTLVKSKDNYLKIENYILSIISIPVVYFFFVFLFEVEFGGYLLNICFAVLYVIAILKVFLLNKIGRKL